MTLARNAKSYPHAAGPHNLTRVEIEVISGLASGKKLFEIAAEHSCSKPAVCKWLQNARRAAGARTNFQLLTMAIKEGLIQ